MGEVYDFIKTLEGKSDLDKKVDLEYEKIITQMANNAKMKFLDVEFDDEDIGMAIYYFLKKEGFYIFDFYKIRNKGDKLRYKIRW